MAKMFTSFSLSFHMCVCVPFLSEAYQINIYSIFCGNQTVFILQAPGFYHIVVIMTSPWIKKYNITEWNYQDDLCYQAVLVEH